jgi:hypothetical protein
MPNFPTRQNPIILSPNRKQTRQVLKELSQQIERNELKSQRLNKPDKIPALPFRYHDEIVYHSWCFTCCAFISEALRHFIIKNRHDARF